MWPTGSRWKHRGPAPCPGLPCATLAAVSLYRRYGKRALDLHGSPGFGGVEQTIATKPGKKYKVTFQMSGNPGVEHEKVQLGVRAAGQDKAGDQQ